MDWYHLAIVVSEEGNPCTTVVRHFIKILNIQIMKARQRSKLAEVLKNENTGGASGILPQMVKAACCEGDFPKLLLDLVEAVFLERE